MGRNVQYLPRRTRRILHALSITGVYMIWFGVLFLVQMLIIEFIPVLKVTTIKGIPVGLPLCVITSIVFIVRFVRAGSPYED